LDLIADSGADHEIAGRLEFEEDQGVRGWKKEELKVSLAQNKI
jgi:hypothetical protein